jgi:hypothetical protein
VALQEMMKHQFLDDKFQQERTAFADGTTVTVDWQTKSMKIEPACRAVHDITSECFPEFCPTRAAKLKWPVNKLAKYREIRGNFFRWACVK